VSGAIRFLPKPVDLEELTKQTETFETKKLKEIIA
jgi:hypothetical protein